MNFLIFSLLLFATVIMPFECRSHLPQNRQQIIPIIDDCLWCLTASPVQVSCTDKEPLDSALQPGESDSR